MSDSAERAVKVFVPVWYVGGTELYDWPTRAYATLQRAQAACVPAGPGTWEPTDAENGARLWRHATEHPRPWPQPVILELEIEP